MKKKKKLFVLLVAAVLLSTTGCAKQTVSAIPINSMFCMGTCIGKH